MEKKITHNTNLTLPLPSSSSIPIFNYYQVHPFSNFHSLPPESHPVKRRFWFLLIDKSRRVIGETSKEISYIVTFKGSYFYFTIISTFPRGTPSLPVPSVFHADHTRPMISKLFDRKPPISGNRPTFSRDLKKNFTEGNFWNELENLTFLF